MLDSQTPQAANPTYSVGVSERDGVLAIVRSAPIEGLLKTEVTIRGRRQIAAVVVGAWMVVIVLARSGLSAHVSTVGWFVLCLVAGIGYSMGALIANRRIVTLSDRHLCWDYDAVPWPRLDIPVTELREFYIKTRSQTLSRSLAGCPRVVQVIALTRWGRTECVATDARGRAEAIAKQLNTFLARMQCAPPGDDGPALAAPKRLRPHLRDILIATIFFAVPVILIAALAPWNYSSLMRGGLRDGLLCGTWFLIGWGLAAIGRGGVSMMKCMRHSRGYDGPVSDVDGLFPLKFVWQNWEEAKRPFLVQLAGMTMIVLSFVILRFVK